jgi:hypothetical protein
MIRCKAVQVIDELGAILATYFAGGIRQTHHFTLLRQAEIPGSIFILVLVLICSGEKLLWLYSSDLHGIRWRSKDLMFRLTSDPIKVCERVHTLMIRLNILRHPHPHSRCAEHYLYARPEQANK